MTIKTSLALLIGLAIRGLAADSTSYPKFYSALDPGCTAAFNEAAKADFDIDYGHDGKFDLGIGPLRDGIHYPITFTFEDLRYFWEKQRHKDFVVVTLAKADLDDTQWRKLAERITDYLFQSGIRRVRIHQAFGNGVGVLSDSTNPAKKSDDKAK